MDFGLQPKMRVRTPEQKEKAYARMAGWRQANRERIRADGARWRRANTEKLRALRRKRKYGLTMDGMAALLEAQNGRCALCSALLNGDSRTHVDHDHETGRVRGLLCNVCNSGLGSFADSPERLRYAAAYLER